MNSSFTRIPFSAPPHVSFPPEDRPAEAEETPGNTADSFQRSPHAVGKLTQRDSSSARDAIRLPATARQAAFNSSTPELYSSTDDWGIVGPHGGDTPAQLYSSQPASSPFQLVSHRLPARATCWSAPPKKQRQGSQPGSPIHPQSARPRQQTARLSARVRSSAEQPPRVPLSAVPSRSQWRHDPAGWQTARPDTKR